MNFSGSADMMVVGVNAINYKKGMIFSLVATYSKSLSQCFTYIDQVILDDSFFQRGISKDQQEEEATKRRAAFMENGLKAALENYEKHNGGNRPRTIIVYRDGIGGPSMVDKCYNFEVPHIKGALDDCYGGSGPKLMYCFVDQKINQRFFFKNGGEHFINAGAGTCVDTQIVESTQADKYDFFLVPHNATVATAIPVHFSVKYTDSDLTKEAFQTLTYHLCYNYFNFGGGIKVPNVVKYAEKAANYCSEIRGKPSDRLSSFLHYL